MRQAGHMSLGSLTQWMNQGPENIGDFPKIMVTKLVPILISTSIPTRWLMQIRQLPKSLPKLSQVPPDSLLWSGNQLLRT